MFVNIDVYRCSIFVPYHCITFYSPSGYEVNLCTKLLYQNCFQTYRVTGHIDTSPVNLQVYIFDIDGHGVLRGDFIHRKYKMNGERNWPKFSQWKFGTSSETNLHGFGFKILILPGCMISSKLHHLQHKTPVVGWSFKWWRTAKGQISLSPLAFLCSSLQEFWSMGLRWERLSLLSLAISKITGVKALRCSSRQTH